MTASTFLLDQIRETGTIHVGQSADFAPFCFRESSSGDLRGLEVDLLQIVTDQLGVATRSSVFPWHELVERLRRREFDLMFSALIPNARWKGIAYTLPYLDGGPILVRRKGDLTIVGVGDLAGKVLLIADDPTLDLALARHSIGTTSESAIQVAEVRRRTQGFFDGLLSGDEDCVLIDSPIAAWACLDDKSPTFGRIETIGEPLAEWIYTAAVRDDDESSSLLAAVDEAIRQLRGTETYGSVVSRWVGRSFDWKKNAGDVLGEAGA